MATFGDIQLLAWRSAAGACGRYGWRLAAGWNGSISPMQSIGEMPVHGNSSEALRNPWVSQGLKTTFFAESNESEKARWRRGEPPEGWAWSGQAAASQWQRSPDTESRVAQVCQKAARRGFSAAPHHDRQGEQMQRVFRPGFARWIRRTSGGMLRDLLNSLVVPFDRTAGPARDQGSSGAYRSAAGRS